MSLNFDWEINEYNQDFNSSTLPPGRYNVILSAWFIKESRSGRGQTLHLTFKVLDGPYEGAEFRQWPAWRHEKQDQVDKMKRLIFAMQKAMGCLGASTIDPMIDKPFAVDLEVDNDFNRITACYAIDEPGKPLTNKPSRNDTPF